jgi:large subunit ribosomal protein L14e
MKNIDTFEVGDLVVSTKGRDAGTTYVIINKVDSNYVRLVDGNHKKFINPKLKKTKHIKLLNIKLEKIEAKIKENTKIFDSEVYSAIKKALENNDSN